MNEPEVSTGNSSLDAYLSAFSAYVETIDPENGEGDLIAKQKAANALNSWIHQETDLDKAVSLLVNQESVINFWRNSVVSKRERDRFNWDTILVNLDALAMLINLCQDTPLYALAREIKTQHSGYGSRIENYLAIRFALEMGHPSKPSELPPGIRSMLEGQGIRRIPKAQYATTDSYNIGQVRISARIAQYEGIMHRLSKAYNRFYYVNSKGEVKCIIEIEKDVSTDVSGKFRYEGMNVIGFRVFIPTSKGLVCLNDPEYNVNEYDKRTRDIEEVLVIEGGPVSF